MLHQLLENGDIPQDVHIIFTNTGKEHEKTYEFINNIEERWGVHINWLEWCPEMDFKPVTYNTASRKGEPFKQLIEKKNYLPNGKERFCTQFLKVYTMVYFMKAMGYDEFTNYVGLRADEPWRVHKRKRIENKYKKVEWEDEFPLYQNGTTIEMINEFWRKHNFKLEVPPGCGNCDGCFMKSTETLIGIEQRETGTLKWWADMEHIVQSKGKDARFKKYRTYADMSEFADKQEELFPIGNDVIDCTCTD